MPHTLQQPPQSIKFSHNPFVITPQHSHPDFGAQVTHPTNDCPVELSPGMHGGGIGGAIGGGGGGEMSSSQLLRMWHHLEIMMIQMMMTTIETKTTPFARVARTDSA